MRTFTSRITTERTSYIEGWSRGFVSTATADRIRDWGIERRGRCIAAKRFSKGPRGLTEAASGLCGEEEQIGYFSRGGQWLRFARRRRAPARCAAPLAPGPAIRRRCAACHRPGGR